MGAVRFIAPCDETQNITGQVYLYNLCISTPDGSDDWCFDRGGGGGGVLPRQLVVCIFCNAQRKLVLQGLAGADVLVGTG